MTRPRRYIWNATDGSFVKRLDGHKAAVTCCTWSELDVLMTGVCAAAVLCLLAFVMSLQATDKRTSSCGVHDYTCLKMRNVLQPKLCPSQ
jgi:hypothetical protein